MSQHVLQPFFPYHLECEWDDMLDVKTLVSSDTVFLARCSPLGKGPVNTGLMIVAIGSLDENHRGLLGTQELQPFLEGVLHLRR